MNILLTLIKTPVTTDNKKRYIEQMKNTLSQKKDSQLILMVPDRFSYIAEKLICTEFGGIGMGGIEVLTLHQLIRRVSKNTDALSPIGKQMVLNGVIEKQINENSVLYPSKDKTGFTERVLEVITAWKRFCVSPEEIIDNVGKAEETTSSKKIIDIANIYKSFIEEFEDKKYKDETDLLIEVAKTIKENKMFKNCSLWVDGFSQMVPAEISIIRAFLDNDADVYVFIPCKINEAYDDDIWTTTKKMESMLVDVCNKYGYSYNVEVKSFKKEMSDDIAFLCDTYEEDKVYTDKCENIKLNVSDDIYSEVEFVASEIVNLVCDKELEYGDISVICGNLGDYTGCVEAVFDKYNIPYYTDYKTPLANHPISILLLSVFDLIRNKSFLTEDVARYLKTGYTLDNNDDIDRLVLFAQKRGIKGSMWLDEKYFTQQPEGVFDEAMGKEKKKVYDSQGMLKLRASFIEPLVSYYDNSKGKKYAKAHIEEFFKFLKSINLYDKIQSKVNELEEMGEENEASGLTYVWNLLINLFDQMAIVLDNKKIDRDTFAKYLRLGIESSDISMIPSVTNGVTISSANNRSGSDAKALFIVGATRNTVPSVKQEDGLISEDEMSLYAPLNEMTGRSRINQSNEFELLRAFSETTRYIYVSTCNKKVRDEGESILFETLKSKFPTIAYHQNKGMFISAPGVMLHKLLVHISSSEELDQYYRSIRDWFSDRDKWSDAFELLDEAEKYKILTESIPKEISAELYKKMTMYSVSRIENYFKCPFMYFLNYGLRLDDGETSDVKSTDVGTLVHYALELFCEQIERDALTPQEKKHRWQEIYKQGVEKTISDIMTGLIEKSGIEDDDKMLSVISRLEKTVVRAAKIIAKMMVNGDYSIYGNELKFEDLKFENHKGDITFHGVIDRIDVCDTEGSKGIRIVDYKTGEKSFDFVEAMNGIGIQIIIYALAAQGIMDDCSQIDGFFYNSIKKRMKSKDKLEFDAAEEERQYKLSGYVVERMGEKSLNVQTGHKMDKELKVNFISDFLPLKLKKDGDYDGRVSSVVCDEVMDKVYAHIKDITIEAASEIQEGDVKVYPYVSSKTDSCMYCPYSSVCMYDMEKGAEINSGEKGKEEFARIKEEINK